MKKLMTLLFVALAVVSVALSGCGGDTGKKDTGKPADAKPTDTKKP